jgi:hypothetical protein
MPGSFNGTIEFPAKTSLDVAIVLMFKVDGVWRSEPSPIGLQHVMILDSVNSTQNVSFAYDSLFCRIVGQTKSGLSVDNYGAASAFATSTKQSAASRQYDYYDAISVLNSGRIAEAAEMYKRFCASVPAGGLSREDYDYFLVYQSLAMAKSGKNAEAIKLLRDQPVTAGNATYQANIQIVLGQLLHETGNCAEGRSIYRDLQKRPELSPKLKDQCTLALALSYSKETKHDSLVFGKNMLRSLSAAGENQDFRRLALLALADAEKRDKNVPETRNALQQAAMLGNTQQRLATKMQLLDLQYSQADYNAVHATCKWILVEGEPGRHLPHILFLDAISLKRLGKIAEGKAQLKRLYEEFRGNAYAEYAASVLGAPVFSIPPADSLAKGAVQQ